MDRTIISSSLTIEKSLTVKKMMAIHQIATKYEGTIYFLYQHNVVLPSHLPKLVALLMMMGPQDELKVIVEGVQPEEILNQVKLLCTNDSQYATNPHNLLMNSTVYV